MRVNKSGCLDQCEHGPTVVVYPDAVWYGRVQPEDAEEIYLSFGSVWILVLLPTSA